MTLHLATASSAAGLFNVGGGIARSWLELAKALFAALNLTPNIQFIEMPEAIRPQYQYYTLADISKIRSTGYSLPTTTLEDAIQEYVTVYLASGARLGDESYSGQIKNRANSLQHLSPVKK
jgi:ADP-L-glycero-D-manno-heptose 6-epimerase